MPAIIATTCHGVTEITHRFFSVFAVTSWREIFFAGMARSYGQI